jgi:CspA family cold shock protein
MSMHSHVFRDTLLTCANCGVEFIWTLAQQRATAQLESPQQPPTRCLVCRKIAAPPDRQRGRVKWYNRSKGWGFVTLMNGGEVFVHRSGLEEGLSSLGEGDLVEFSVEETPKGPQAVHIRRLTVTNSLDPEQVAEDRD